MVLGNGSEEWLMVKNGLSYFAPTVSLVLAGSYGGQVVRNGWELSRKACPAARGVVGLPSASSLDSQAGGQAVQVGRWLIPRQVAELPVRRIGG